MPLYKTEAINLKSSKFAEADKLVTLFTKTHGKITAIAKSAYRAGSKFGGRLEPFAYNQVLLAKGKSLDIISQMETIETFHKLRENEYTLRAGLYMARIADSFLEKRAKDPALFNLFLECLRMLKDGISPNTVTRIFDIRFADIEGFLPFDDFSSDVRPLILELQAGRFENADICGKSLREIDSILTASICEHVGKDIRNWKNM